MTSIIMTRAISYNYGVLYDLSENLPFSSKLRLQPQYAEFSLNDLPRTAIFIAVGPRGRLADLILGASIAVRKWAIGGSVGRIGEGEIGMFSALLHSAHE